MSEFLRAPELTVAAGADFSIPSAYLGKGKNFPQNFQLYRGEMKKRLGRSVIGGIMLGGQKVLHLDVFTTTGAVERLIRHSKQNVERFVAASQAWEDITGVDLSGAETDFIQSCVVTENDLYVFTNNIINAIRKYTDSGTTSDLGGNPPKCRTLDYLSPYLLIGNVLDGGNSYPQKVQWCDTGQPEVWSGGNSGSVLLADEPSHIKRIKKLIDYAFVYKEKSVYRGRKVSTSAIFEFGGPFADGKGIYSPRAIAGDGSNDYYMGLFDFHKNNAVRISDFGAPVREYIFNRINRERSDTCFAIHVAEFKEIWFFITIAGYDWPTEVWKYNYDIDFWYFDTVVNCITAAIYKQTVDLTWDTDFGTWDEDVTFWDEQQGLSGAPFPVLGYADGMVDYMAANTVDDRGAAVDARIDTKDYTGLVHRGIEYDTEWMQFSIWCRGRGSVKLWYSIDEGSNWVFIAEKDLTLETKKLDFYFHFIAPKARWRIQTDRAGEYLMIRNFTPYFRDNPEMLT